MSPQTTATKSVDVDSRFDQTKLELIKRTLCRAATDDELQLFIHACKRTGLDPFMRQIFAVKRWDSSEGREVMTIQTGIDGYRLIADRTGRYAPGRDTEFGYDEQGNLRWAKSYVKKMTPDGQWHEISAIVFWNEYVQTTKDGRTTLFWMKKGHVMLSKCAEALALRKAFPAELSGIYTREEMAQDMATSDSKSTPRTINCEQVGEIEELVAGDPDFQTHLLSRLQRAFGCRAFKDLPLDQFDNVKKVIEDHDMQKEAS